MRKTLLITVLCLVLIAFSGVALGKEWPGKTNVPVDHIWTIKFSQPVDTSTIAYHSVDGTYTYHIYFTTLNRKIAIFPDFKFATDGKTILVDAVPDFEPNTTYVLYIENIKSMTGQEIEQNLLMFTTAKEN